MPTHRSSALQGRSLVRSERGGIALEYVLVTTFAAVVGLSLLGVASQVFRHKLAAIASEAGVDLEQVVWNPFGENTNP